MADSLIRPDYDRARVVYHGRDWHSFSTKAIMHLIDYGSALRKGTNSGEFMRDVFHYRRATVTLDMFIPDDSTKMQVALEFITEKQARRMACPARDLAFEFMNAVKADALKYSVRDGPEPTVPRSRRVRQA